MRKVRLGEICDILNGYAFKSSNYVSDGIRVIRITNVQKGYIADDDPKFYPIDTQDTLKKYMLNQDDLLVSLTGNVGRVGLLPKSLLPAALNQRVACLRLKKSIEEIDTKYLFYALNSDVFENACINSSNGIAQKNLSTEWLKDYHILLYSVEEQKCIVKKLDLIIRLINLRKKQLQKLDELVKSRFIEMFGDLKANSKHWKIMGFNEFAQIDTRMIHDFSNYENYPHIGIDSIEKDTGRISGYRTVKQDGVISGKYLFTPLHIIYSKIRPNLNKVALPDFNGVCSADAYPILPKENICDRYFLAYVMRSEVFLSYILAFSSRTNMPKVNRKQVEGFACPMPSYELQNEFANFVKSTDKSKTAIQKSLDDLETLKKSLMQQYFA